MYKVELAKSAIKELSKIPQEEGIRIAEKIITLRGNPRPKGCVKLTGTKNEYRIRIGRYRVLYTIEERV